MAIIKNDVFIKKAEDLKKSLKCKNIFPVRTVCFEEDSNSFQNLKVINKGDFSLPFVMNSGDRVILDFGVHCVGYLNFSLDNYGGVRICDSPVKLKFSFGEFPYEILKPVEEYNGTLGNGWIQREERAYALMPYNGSLERRYAFRYLMIERTDNARFPIVVKDIFAKSVSAVDISDAATLEIKDERLRKIYDTALKTLMDCEQDVFEDGPKRDRRLWLGDLRLQALTDYRTFKNYDLVKRCLYLFAGYRVESKKVSSCLFSESAPYIDDLDEWIFLDYCLFYISCLYDYYQSCKDTKLVEELYGVALEQVTIASEKIDKQNGKVSCNCFIDWCPNLDKQVAFLGVYIYTLRQFKELTETLGKETLWIENEISEISKLLLKFYSEKNGLFITESGQISWHSQVWAVLSGVMSNAENIELLKKTEKLDTEFTMRTPYMIHYYIEALYNNGLKEQAIETVKEIWGKMVDCGYDCFPEVFNPKNDFESPYNAPEINSACHAWSCTPAYWIQRYIIEE